MPILNSLFLLTILGFGILIYSATFGRKKLCITEVNIFLKRLPSSFNGIKIILFSDLHLGFFCTQEDLLFLTGVINSLNPDVICFAGDLTDKRTGKHQLEEAVPILKKLTASYGKYAVLGNHDYHTGPLKAKRALEDSGFLVLTNQSTVLEKNGQKVCLIGLDDVIKGKVEIQKTLSSKTQECCSIILVHEPDCADEVARYSIDLQMSGHSHGGQVRLPIIGPIRTTKLGKRYIHGLYNIGNMQLFTTQGVGTTILPIRFFCRPEIVILTLKSF